MESELARAIKRVREAYAMNHIQWDSAISRLPVSLLNHLADCWERRAVGLPVDEGHLDDRLTIRECKKIIDSVKGRLRPGKREGQAVFERQWRDYHGS